MPLLSNQRLYAAVSVGSFVAALVLALHAASIDPSTPLTTHFQYENAARGMVALCAISTVVLAKLQEWAYAPWFRGVRQADEREMSVRNASFERAYTFFPLLTYFTFYWAGVSPSYGSFVPVKVSLLIIMFFGLPQILATLRK